MFKKIKPIGVGQADWPAHDTDMLQRARPTLFSVLSKPKGLVGVGQADRPAHDTDMLQRARPTLFSVLSKPKGLVGLADADEGWSAWQTPTGFYF